MSSRPGAARTGVRTRRPGWRVTWPRGSVGHRVSDDAIQRLDAVLPADLLAFLVVSAVVADGHLVDPAAARGAAVERRHLEPGDLGRHLGLEPEAVALERDALDHLAAEDLVADLHV